MSVAAVAVVPVVEETGEAAVSDGGEDVDEVVVVVVVAGATAAAAREEEPIMVLKPWLWCMAPRPQVKPLVREGVEAAALAAQLYPEV